MCRSLTLTLGTLVAAVSIITSPQVVGGQEQGQPFPLPTQAPPGAHYVGPATCARCHPSEAETQPLTPMAHALESVTDCTILRSHPRLAFRSGPYSYLVERRDSGSALTVIKGEQAFSEPILWAFGQGLDKAKQGRLTSSNTKARIMRAELAFTMKPRAST